MFQKLTSLHAILQHVGRFSRRTFEQKIPLDVAETSRNSEQWVPPSPSLFKATALHKESRCESSSQGKAMADVPDLISRPNKLMSSAARPQRQMSKPGSYR